VVRDSVPGIIHNASYFFVDLPVSSDGIVDCWEDCDLAAFRQKLVEGRSR